MLGEYDFGFTWATAAAVWFTLFHRFTSNFRHKKPAVAGCLFWFKSIRLESGRYLAAENFWHFGEYASLDRFFDNIDNS